MRRLGGGPVVALAVIQHGLRVVRVGQRRALAPVRGAAGHLLGQFGRARRVDLSRVTWVLSGDEHVAEYQPPPNVVPAGPGQDVPAMVASGELTAGIGIPADYPGVVPLIPDAAEAGYRALRDRGFYPINHVLVVRDELLAEHPDLAADLFAAYADAKKRYVADLAEGFVTDPGPTDRMYARVMQITSADPLPYGIAPNRAMIDQLIRYAVDQ